SGDQVAQKVYAISEAAAFVDMTAAAEAAGTVEAEEADAEAGEAEEAEAEAEATTYTASADGVTVTVTAPVGALPENVELIVTLLDEDSDAYTEAAEAVGYDAEDEDTGMAAMDISFYDGDGLEVEPTAPVSVSIDASALLPEEADAETIEVQHLTETETGVEATLVADADNGVDTDAATVEFEVESFSTFTLTWSNGDSMSGGPGGNNSASVTATATSYLSDTSTVIGDSTETLSLSSGTAVALTEDNYCLRIDGYTLDYATIKIGSSSAVTATSITVTMTTTTTGGGGYGPGQSQSQSTTTTYTVTYIDSNGTEQTYSSTSEPSITISLYYTKNNPSVEISVSGSSDAYTLTATPSDFSGDPSYSWEITDESANATIKPNDDGTATVTWSENASEGDTVTVQVTATYTDDDGNKETATSTYTLYYGYELLIVYVTCNGDSAAEGATVTITDTSGATQTGTTDENGCVSFWVSDATTYTISASYAVSTSQTLTGSETIIVNGVTTETIDLTSSASKGSSVISSKSFNHIDVKFEGAESEGSEGYTLDDVTSIYIYNASNTLVYYSTEKSTDTSTGEWRFTFKNTSGTTVQNLTLYTSYSIVVTYTVIDSNNQSHTYTATITSDSTYADGATYSTDGDNAYKLYNYLYGTSYSSNAELKMDGITEVDIGGMSVYLVAAILCNGSTVSGYNNLSGTDGLDFVLDLGTLLKYSANWDFEVEKTFKNSGMDAGQFTFILASASVTNSVWTIGDTLQTQTNSAANASSDGNSTDTISFTQINYSSDDVGTYYYIVYEQNGGTTVDGIAYSSAVYGVVVTVTTTETTSTSGTKTVTTAVTATYYNLKWDSNSNGYVVTGDAINTWTWSSSGSTLISLPFTNSYASSTDFTIVKVDADNTSTTLSGAEFTLTSSDGSTYYKADGTAETSEVTLTTDSDGKISVKGISNGTYTLTETAAPDGYNLLTGTVTITVSGGTVTAYYDGENILTTDSDGNYIITVKNEAGYVLPSTGGSGTWLYTLTGLTLCGAALVLWKRREQD
ncbi:MAG: LPXTG cell wall anchor domain-containing protein, partial [Clostridiales bacterium]|nr:LPXTG cell wall anchor domain-containing protein [Clostridiales bacterium]